MLVSIPQFMAAVGICAGYFTCYGSIKIDSSISWRLPFILMAATGILLAVSCLYLPPSPRWLIVNGRQEDAMRSLDRLNISRAEVERDISKLTARSGSKLSTWQATRSIFQKKYRLRTILGLFVLGMVQLSGIDGVLYVSSKSLNPHLHRLRSSIKKDRSHANYNSMLLFFSPKQVYLVAQPHSLRPESQLSSC